MRRIVLALAVLLSARVHAQRPPDLPLTPELRARLLDAAAERIEKFYVFPDKAVLIAKALRDAESSPEVAAATTALALVPVVNRVLQSAVHDEHLRFGYSAVADTRAEDAPETPAEAAEAREEARRNGFGIAGVQRLDGNIGLLTWTKFYEPALAGEAVVTAMKLLQSTDALIIDLRASDGGSPEMVLLLLSYFVPEGDPVHVSTMFNRFTNTTAQQWTLAFVPPPRYTGRDVYVLTSARTWSAGEGFAEHMRRIAHATLVGETTRGGAHPARWMTIDPQFAVSVPVARAIEGTVDWEGKGVPPDIATSAADALATAHRLALTRLRDRASDADTRSFYESAIAAVASR
ncbi:MAG: S41 family peptidase [Acidobacteria bacterium]|nr:S41 family peptidase [Acidobacteriota bacterium]MBV9478507.1 S41 family peptidase [Acidobacteriota bacterium]